MSLKGLSALRNKLKLQDAVTITENLAVSVHARCFSSNFNLAAIIKNRPTHLTGEFPATTIINESGTGIGVALCLARKEQCNKASASLDHPLARLMLEELQSVFFWPLDIPWTHCDPRMYSVELFYLDGR